MPVLATIAAINFFSGSDAENSVSFLNPEMLRERCRQVIEDEDKRNKAIKLSDDLQRLSAKYQQHVITTVEAYIDESVKWDSSADGLIDILEPMDDSRRQTLLDIIQVRQSMKQLLTSEQWHKLFS